MYNLSCSKIFFYFDLQKSFPKYIYFNLSVFLQKTFLWKKKLAFLFKKYFFKFALI